MARLLEVFLDEAFAATEGSDGLTGCRLEQLLNFFLLVGHLDAATAATESRLDGNRQAVNLDEVENLFSARNRVDGARGQRCANLLGNVTG